MATASSFLSEDQFLCSICLDVFTDPVSIPCGHNFCKACLGRHWEGKEHCQCPLCNEKFNKGIKLRVNTGFREVVENFKKQHVKADDDSQVKAGHVPCDCCLGNKLKASKTCLVCLASFCETHLEPHRRVAALKRHKLTNPVHNLDDKICKSHNRIFELFCVNDQVRVCVQCTDHAHHDTVPLEEEYVDKRVQMWKKEAEVHDINQKMKVAAQSKRNGKNEARANSEVSDQMPEPNVWSSPNEHSHHFSGCHCIPGNTGVSEGRSYYEVRGRTGWELGVVRESMRGRRRSRRRPSNGNWTVRSGNDSCEAPHNIPVLRKEPERVIVFVDYENGLVSFYDVDSAVMLYSFTGCNFSETVFLFFRPSNNVALARRRRRRKSNTLFSFFILAFALVMIFIYLFFHLLIHFRDSAY